MKRLKIYDQKFSLRNPVITEIFGSTKSSEHFRPSYARALFFDKKNPKVISAIISSGVYKKPSEARIQTINNLLKAPLDFNQCLVVSTLYFAEPIPIIKRLMFDTISTGADGLGHILGNTRGFMVYTYQFEQIARHMLGILPDEAIALRKTYNKLRASIDTFNLDPTKLWVFKQVLKNHVISQYGVLHQPYYEGAKNLMWLYDQKLK